MQFTDNERNHNIKTLEKFFKVFATAAIDELEETYQCIASQGVRPQDNMRWLIQNINKKSKMPTPHLMQSPLKSRELQTHSRLINNEN